MEIIEYIFELIKQFFIYTGQKDYFQFWWTVAIIGVSAIGVLAGTLGANLVVLVMVWGRLGKIIKFIEYYLKG